MQGQLAEVVRAADGRLVRLEDDQRGLGGGHVVGNQPVERQKASAVRDGRGVRQCVEDVIEERRREAWAGAQPVDGGDRVRAGGALEDLRLRLQEGEQHPLVLLRQLL